jgi:4'-phosphopantetheinyl transferase EntD
MPPETAPGLVSLASVEDALAAMTPRGWAHCVAPIADHFAELFPEEQVLMRDCVEGRRQEFATGRRCVRQALQALGVAPAPIMPGASRAPTWPDGFRASLSHSKRLCVAVAAPARMTRQIGLDVEWTAGVEPALLESIAANDEVRANQHETAARDLAACLFSIKEAVFKAYNPSTGAFLEYSDLRVRLNGSQSAFRAELTRATSPSLFGKRRIAGRFALAGGYVLSLVSA